MGYLLRSLILSARKDRESMYNIHSLIVRMFLRSSFCYSFYLEGCLVDPSRIYEYETTHWVEYKMIVDHLYQI